MKFFSIISFTVLAATLFLASGVEPAARPAALPKTPITADELNQGFKRLRPTIKGAEGTLAAINKIEKHREAKDQLNMATEFFGQDAAERARTAGHAGNTAYIQMLEKNGELAVKDGAKYNKLLHKAEMLQKAAADAARMNNPKAAAVALQQSRVAVQELAANSNTVEQKKKTSRIMRRFKSMRKFIMGKLKWLLNKATFGKYKYDKTKYAKKKKPVAATAPVAGAPVAVAVAAAAPAPAHPGDIVAAAAAAAVPAAVPAAAAA
jgi:hypothetical protein